MRIPNIEVRVLPFSSDPDVWPLLKSYFALRKEVFMDQLGWPLLDAGGLELEEYDHSEAMYVIALDTDTGDVVGGARLLRTDSEMVVSSVAAAASSYMIRDAYLGLLEDIPEDICTSAPPTDPCVWELTRFVSKDQSMASTDILFAVNGFLLSQGAIDCLFLGSPSFLRMSRMLGFSPKPLGPAVAGDSGPYIVFSCAPVPGAIRAPVKRTLPQQRKNRGVPVAELFDEQRTRVGLVYLWNTGEEEISWDAPDAGHPAHTNHLTRVDLPRSPEAA